MSAKYIHRKPIKFISHRGEKVLRVHKDKTSVWRIGVQSGFAVLSLILGYIFANFVRVATNTPSGNLPLRPPGIEGYLPISGLMGAIDWIYQGTLNTIHPAATVLFIIFVGLSWLLRKSFCGWICPVGFVSENLARIGKLIFGRNYKLPKYLDWFLQSIKYLLLGFFVWAIFSMSPTELSSFIHSPYNKISDVKMLLFFTDMSKTALVVVGVLAVLSVPLKSFWCRYLCPYGALLGIFARLSPVKVRRNTKTCIDCGLCDNACPAHLPVMTSLEVNNVECIGCGDCVTSCPVPTALKIGTKFKPFSSRQLAVTIIGLFAIGYAIAVFSGNWHSRISDEEYRQHIQNMNSGEYSHPGM